MSYRPYENHLKCHRLYRLAREARDAGNLDVALKLECDAKVLRGVPFTVFHERRLRGHYNED